MRLHRTSANLLIEPPSVATGDIAFNLLIFFLVCASSQPDSGRKQTLPSRDKEQKSSKMENVEVSLTRSAVLINGNPVKDEQFLPQLQKLLQGKTRPEDKVVIVKSRKDTPYHRWVLITGQIEQAGGVITLQLEETREQVVQ